MNPIIVYFFKVNIAIALFYLFYKLFFAGDTFWKARRIYLLISLLISFVYPFISITSWLQQQESVQTVLTNIVQLREITITPEKGFTFDIEYLVYIAYVFISIVLLIKLAIQYLSIHKIKKSGYQYNLNGIKVIRVSTETAPFSFFKNIYLNPDLHADAEIKQILSHETTHVNQLHSIDVLLSEFLIVLCWINPFIWLYKKEIRQNLEFLADNNVIASGFDTKIYQYHLLQLSCQLPKLELTNKFNVSPLKKRITMMNQKKSSKAGILKYLLIAPLAFALIVSSNAESLITKATESLQQEKSTKVTTPASKLDENTVVGYAATQVVDETSKKPATKIENELLPPPPPTPVEDQVFMVVEEMPKYPGGDSEMFKFLAQNIKYPVAALQKGIQGKVFCQFVINADGSIGNVETVRSVDSELDAEAVRVIKAMPNWTPGKQRGQNVRVKYTLPINFKLNDGDKKTNTNGDEKPKTTEIKIPENPMYILDGKIISKNDMAQLQPESIKEINVLKDESAVKIYGEKGKNGVVLITSKN